MFGSLIDAAGTRYTDRLAFVIPDHVSLSYSELAARVRERAGQLIDAGVTPGGVVALRLDSDEQYLVSALAVQAMGGICAGVSPVLAEAEADRLIAHLDPTLLIDSHWIAAAPNASSQPCWPLSSPESPCAIVFTSGTTGTPKGALFRQRQITAIMRADLGERWAEEWDRPGAMFISTQFAHVGFMTKVWWYLKLGLTMVAIPKWRPREVLKVIREYRPAAFGAIAPQLAILLNHPDFATTDVSCINTLIAGGASSPPDLIQRARERFGATYSVRYSSTESGGVGISIDYPLGSPIHQGVIGHPRAQVEATIRTEDGVEVAPGDVGELWLRSPTCCDGYWNNPAATAALFADGWIRTGDLAQMGEHGIALCGRRSEMYIRGGYNVYPSEVEAVLSTHPAVLEIAIAPVADAVLGELGCAVVAAREPLELETLRRFGEHQLARYKLPERLVLVDALPLTPMAKIDRTRLAEIARAQFSDPSADGTS